MTYVPAKAKCNVCDAQTADDTNNSWYLIQFHTGKITISEFFIDSVAAGIPCVCGQACLLKFVSQHISVIYPPSQEIIAAEDAEKERNLSWMNPKMES